MEIHECGSRRIEGRLCAPSLICMASLKADRVSCYLRQLVNSIVVQPLIFLSHTFYSSYDTCVEHYGRLVELHGLLG